MDYPDRRISKGTIIYKMKKYADSARLTLHPGDLIVGVDPTDNDVWILERQSVR